MISKKELLFQIILHVVVLLFFAYSRTAQIFRTDRIWFFLIYAAAAVLVSYVLMPKLLYRKKYWQFLAAFVFIVTMLIVLEETVLEQILYPNTRRAATFPGVFVSLLGVLPIMTVLSSGKFAWDAIEKQQKIDELQGVVQESELQFLRSQINPHFLFNNLNNLYSYALEASSKTPEIILGISGVLRYMLYECKERFVPLEKELKQLANFVQLYNLQIEERGTVKFTKRDIKNGYKIAPLILIVFIENAFKHSQSGQSSNIEIFIDLYMKHNVLHFRSKNNFQPSNDIKSLDNGIGLENVEKRLALLYPKKHAFAITKEDDYFIVDLSLNLKKE
ncbi:MAG: histidine kinase [Bacteroidota bacterium]